MIKESLQPSQTSERPQISQLKEWLHSHGIKAVLFDLDDTILDTQRLHRKKEEEFVDYLASHMPMLDKSQISETFHDLDKNAFRTHSVSRERLQAVVAHMVEKYGPETTSLFYEAKKILDQIYDSAPEFLPGALDTLETFRSSTEKMGVVTHAEDHWTYVKLDKRGLRKYFDSVTIANPFGHKGPSDWKRAIDSLNVEPEEVLVIGDNVAGDITAAREAGVTYTVLLPSPWELYTQGEIHESTVRVDRIADVIPVLIRIA